MRKKLILLIFFVCFGLLVGSFLNVVIYRIPRDLSVVTPRSSCPKCKHMIKWYENIPVISYLFLRGKCQDATMHFNSVPTNRDFNWICRISFSSKVLSPKAIFNLFFIFRSRVFSFATFSLISNFRFFQINSISIFLFIVLPYVFIKLSTSAYWFVGALVGFGGPFIVTYLFYKLRGVIGLGGGDIKLFGILGIILGPVGVVKTIFFSCFIGSIIGIILILS